MSNGIGIVAPVAVANKPTQATNQKSNDKAKGEVVFGQVLSKQSEQSNGIETSSKQTKQSNATEASSKQTGQSDTKESLGKQSQVQQNTTVKEASLFGSVDKLKEVDMKQLMETLEGLPEELIEVVTTLLEKWGLESSDEAGEENVLQQINKLIEEQPDLKNLVVAFLGQIEQTTVVNVESKSLDSDTVAKLNAMFEQVKGLLQQLSSQGEVPKETQMKLLKLLEQWTAVEKQAGQSAQSLLTNESGLQSKEQTIWSKLLDAYQKRETFQGQQKYQQSAQVTSSDIGKWVKQLVNSVGTTAVDDVSAGQAPVGTTLTNMPMSQVEQYIIHVGQGNSEETAETKLLNEIQRVLQSSKFLSKNNNSQLFLKLRPEHLGDILIKMTQLNGETTVKILVQSQAAKDMLESNMHQLKHMFSPQQVVVEKQEGSLLNQQNSDNPKQSLQEDRQSSENKQSSYVAEDSQNEEEESGISFSDILMNEKV
ncbi:flagellar hook-length control protein FliK [Radiobacillus deserti]|uniref:Flagellar hook-length control protein-like C-terminal domain-containing protein n=1 Tax=Radiobacillus deserti TaxID=2594883 RepID=A0A516KFM6_9BACI|nr:flagellar hook-length control protein FliK [Radiobacillus deserti]QDP40179.1 hypothetical protein FN924_08350 [Radiobacillus deserti]